MLRWLFRGWILGLLTSLCIAFREDLTEVIIDAYDHILKELM
jgi:hypothetical protein